MTTQHLPARFSAQIVCAYSRTSLFISGDLDGYGLEELVDTARRYGQRVQVRLEGGEPEGVMKMVAERFAGFSERGIEVTLACA